MDGGLAPARAFRKVLVANRGEIAVRIIRTCQDLGIETILAHSTADADSLAAELATEAHCIGPPAAAASYLNVAAILALASHRGADAIHPGYGFLAENPALAEACRENGIVFIGPSPDALRQMGNKVAARRIAEQAGLPVVPGTADPVDVHADGMLIADEVGYPLLIKAAAGGGGRGMRLVERREEAPAALSAAAGEAQAAFGDGSVYLERFIADARHIEVQIVGDRHGNVIHLGERDCTLQRRYQKVMEEGPSPVLPPATREQLCRAAVALGEHVGYEGAGTVEFLYDARADEFFFIEMNTRLQVEHPVTELLTGLDLVALQLEAAQGARLSVEQEQVRIEGHAIEFRITAEDAAADFQPGAGRLDRWRVPQGPNVRVDTHCFAGYQVPPYYDSLLAKVLVWGPTRPVALQRARRALGEVQVEGVPTTTDLHLALLDHPDVQSGSVSTRWLEQHLPELVLRLRR